MDGKGVEQSLCVYQKSTTTSAGLRTEEQIMRFITGFELVEPGLVWVTDWRPAPGDPTDFAADPKQSSMLAGLGKLTRPRRLASVIIQANWTAKEAVAKAGTKVSTANSSC